MPTSEVILTENIRGLGAEADIVKVKRGYARNFLLPKGKAYEVTPVTLKRINLLKAKRAQREGEERNAADELRPQDQQAHAQPDPRNRRDRQGVRLDHGQGPRRRAQEGTAQRQHRTPRHPVGASDQGNRHARDSRQALHRRDRDVESGGQIRQRAARRRTGRSRSRRGREEGASKYAAKKKS